MKQRIPTLATSLCLLAYLACSGPAGAGPTEALAQIGPIGGALPDEVRAEVLDFLNDPATLRMPGGTRIPEGTRVEGPLGVLGGGLRISGTIEGPVVVVNGDLELLAGGRIEGSVLVVGGRVHADAAAVIMGESRSYSAPLRFRIRGDIVEPLDPTAREIGPVLEADLGFATLRPTLRSGGNYNRTEGLPVLVGPVLRTRGRNPTLVEAFALWRSSSGLELDRDNIGYLLRAEQELGGSGEGRLGITLHSSIQPVESRGISNPEAAFTTFFLHRDVRDYFEAKGWSTYLEFTPVSRPVTARFEYREEDHGFAPIVNPWTLRDRELPWRPQPLVAEGPLRSLSFGLTVDTRDDVFDPSIGWLAQTTVRRRVGGDLRIPEFNRVDETASAVSVEDATQAFPLSTDAELDLRRYNRVGPNTRLNFRLFLAGSIDGSPLPPQFQRTLGGEGSLPGHPRFSLDCGARSGRVMTTTIEEAFPAYGCDRVGLFQVEFQGYLPFSWSPDPDRHPDWETGSLLEIRPAWTVFGGVGRGRALTDELDHDLRTSSPTRADMGVGIFVGPLGLYWAFPLNRRDQGVNFFIRLDRRF